MTVLAGALVSALAAALVAVVMIEEAVEANHRRGVQALYAADGLLASVIAELAGRSDWHAMLEGAGSARFRGGPVRASLPDGSVVDVRAEARALPPDGDAQWRPFAWGWFGDLVAAPDHVPPLYLAAWVLDAPADADLGADANGRLVVRAAAFGPFHVRRVVEATMVRRDAAVQVVAWNIVR